MDEATAFTDPENEDKIQQSIMALTKGKTLLVIAHRLSTIQKRPSNRCFERRQRGSYGNAGRTFGTLCVVSRYVECAHRCKELGRVAVRRCNMFRTVGRILHWCKDYKARIFWGCVCSFFETWFAAFPTMLAAYMLGMVIDDARASQHLTQIIYGSHCLPLSGLLFAVGCLHTVATACKKALVVNLRQSNALQWEICLKEFLSAIFRKNNIGNIVATMTNEFSTLELQSMKMVDRVINGYVNMLAIILALFVISWQAALVALGGVVLSFLFLLLISRRSSKTAPVRIKAVEDMADSSIEYVRGLPIVKSFGKEGAAIANFQKACKDLKDININIELGFTPLNCMHLLMLKIASVGLVAVSALLCLVDMISLPYMLMLCMFAFTIFAGVENINDAAHVLSIVDTALNHLDDIEQSGAIDENGKPVTLTNYEIKFNNVTFGYDSRKIFENVSLCIPENTTTAIVGRQAAAKQRFAI